MTSDPYAISRISAEFVDPRLETRFRQQEEIHRQLFFIVLTTSVIWVLGMGLDFYSFYEFHPQALQWLQS